MRILEARNVCGLLPLGLDLLMQDGRREESRNGPVIVAPWPVVSVYERPTERVLLSPTRDANPFFHLFEALWMLAGRDDAASLDHYVRDFGARFAESDGRIHGAYGRRWRGHFCQDQLGMVIKKLHDDPTDRQVVITMWDPMPTISVPHADEGDLVDMDDTWEVGAEDLTGSWKDRPCNTHAYLRMREDSSVLVLDLSVLCRSNDIVWGAYGANAVHFSFLQEYLAGRIGCGVGKLYQFSNNYHGYVRELDRIGDPITLLDEYDPYESGEISTLPIGSAWEKWDQDLHLFMTAHDNLWRTGVGPAFPITSNSWFAHTAWPLVVSNWYWRAGDFDSALHWAGRIDAPDWRRACTEWLNRRTAL